MRPKPSIYMFTAGGVQWHYERAPRQVTRNVLVSPEKFAHARMVDGRSMPQRRSRIGAPAARGLGQYGYTPGTDRL